MCGLKKLACFVFPVFVGVCVAVVVAVLFLSSSSSSSPSLSHRSSSPVWLHLAIILLVRGSVWFATSPHSAFYGDANVDEFLKNHGAGGIQ